MTREEALAAGLKTYDSEKLCGKGHSERYVVSEGCAVCSRARVLAGYHRNPQRANARRAAWASKNQARDRERGRLWRRKQRGQIEGPTRPMPDACEVCDRGREGRSLHEDHDHVTGLFRGWLCYPCNTALGKLGDTVEGVMRAVEYLRAVASRRLLDTGIEDD
jgi:Recombination endonuclease VII